MEHKNDKHVNSKSTSFEMILPLVIIAFACIIFSWTQDIRDTSTASQLGPKFWPRIALLGIIVCNAVRLIEIWWKIKSISANSLDAFKPKDEIKSWANLGLTVVWITIYFTLIHFIGFFMASFIFLMGFMYLWRYRHFLRVIIISLIGTMVIAWIFVGFAYIPLPKGEFFFEDITIFIYRMLKLI